MIDGFGDEHEGLEKFDDDLSERQKRHIDSMNYTREKERLSNLSRHANRQSYYNAMDAKESKNREDEQYDRSMKMLKMLDNENNKNANSGNLNMNTETSDWKKIR